MVLLFSAFGILGVNTLYSRAKSMPQAVISKLIIAVMAAPGLILD